MWLTELKAPANYLSAIPLDSAVLHFSVVSVQEVIASSFFLDLLCEDLSDGASYISVQQVIASSSFLDLLCEDLYDGASYISVQ